MTLGLNLATKISRTNAVVALAIALVLGVFIGTLNSVSADQECEVFNYGAYEVCVLDVNQDGVVNEDDLSIGDYACALGSGDENWAQLDPSFTGVLEHPTARANNPPGSLLFVPSVVDHGGSCRMYNSETQRLVAITAYYNSRQIAGHWEFANGALSGYLYERQWEDEGGSLTEYQKKRLPFMSLAREREFIAKAFARISDSEGQYLLSSCSNRELNGLRTCAYRGNGDFEGTTMFFAMVDGFLRYASVFEGWRPLLVASANSDGTLTTVELRYSFKFANPPSH